MNLKTIKAILNEDMLSDDHKESLIFHEMSKDSKVLPRLLAILDEERQRNKEIMRDMNALLGKADVALDNKKLNKDNFIQREVKEFYVKWKDIISHCFRDYKKEEKS